MLTVLAIVGVVFATGVAFVAFVVALFVLDPRTKASRREHQRVLRWHALRSQYQRDHAAY